MATANEIQFGGDHYKGAEYQHWDWVTAIGMEYVPAVACKYISRWRRKNGLEDLQKAGHYIQKAEELGLKATRRIGARQGDNMSDFWRFTLDNRLTLQEAIACYYVMEGEWEAARLVVQELANGAS